MSGTASYDIVYIDGTLQLTGDTTINASSIYIGPDASIDSCFVPNPGNGNGGNGNGCTSGRSLTLHASGPVIVANGIGLQCGSGSSRFVVNGIPVSPAGGAPRPSKKR